MISYLNFNIVEFLGNEMTLYRPSKETKISSLPDAFIYLDFLPLIYCKKY